MKKFLFTLCILLLTSSACFAQSAVMGAGGIKKKNSGGGGGAAPTFDSGCTSTFNGLSCSLTTTQTNDLIIAVVGASNGTEVVSGAGLTWTKVGVGNPSLWWAISSGVLTAQSINTTVGQNITAFAVNGAHNAAPFDGSILMATGTSSTITTTAANDLIFSIKTDYCDPVDSTFTQFGLQTYQTGEYKTAATAGSYTFSWAGCASTTAIVTGAVLAGP